MIKSKTDLKYFLLLHLVVFIWGWTGILGKLIHMEVLPMIWIRMSATVLILLIYGIALKKTFSIEKKDLIKLMATGILIALHWLFFYRTIQIANVSIAVICLSTSTFFNAILDPLINRRKWLWYEFLISFVVIICIGFIFKYQPGFEKGIVYGIISAFFSASFTTVNGIMSKNFDSVVFSVYELFGGVVFLSLALLFIDVDIQNNLFNIDVADWIYLLILITFCTAFPFVASAFILKKISSFTVLLAINLEPVYTIIFAWLIFGDEEKMDSIFYIGSIVIILTLFVNAWIKNKWLIDS